MAPRMMGSIVARPAIAPPTSTTGAAAIPKRRSDVLLVTTPRRLTHHVKTWERLRGRLNAVGVRVVLAENASDVQPPSLSLARVHAEDAEPSPVLHKSQEQQHKDSN